MEPVATIVAEPPACGLSQRERAKHDRRRRIIDAAHDLLREEGIEALSGKAIAARAGVSLSTIYNLFGSKDAVLVAVYDDDLAQFEAALRARPASGGIVALFDALDVAIALYAADPAFYRATMWRRASDALLEDAFREPRVRFWQRLVARARDDGALRPDTDVAALGRLLVYIYGGAMNDWIVFKLTLAALSREIAFGFAVALLPFATDATRARLDPMIAAPPPG